MGATKIIPSNPNPAGEHGWLTNKQWCAIEELSDLSDNIFTGFAKEFTANIDAWEAIHRHSTPYSPDVEWPEGFSRDPKFTLFHRLIAMNIFNPDKIIPGMYALIMAEMGQLYVEPPAFDLGVAFMESSKDVPLIFIISPGVDPRSEISKLAYLRSWSHMV